MSTTITIPGDLARQLVREDLDGTEPYAVQARREVDSTDHETVNHLIIREQATGRLFSATYRDAVYEGSAPEAWEYDKEVVFREVVARQKVTVTTEYVRVDSPPADVSKDVIANAYVNGDGGYKWLTCGLCDDPLLEVDAGTALPEMLAEVTGHDCPEGDTKRAGGS